MAALPGIAAAFPEAAYREITYPQFRTLMAVRTAATGKAFHRLNVPGCEDFLIADPSFFGKVLAALFAVTAGADGRPVGHHYPDGIVVHYRPQAEVTRAGLEAAWSLNLRLREAVLRPEFTVSDRVEHGLGLALARDSPAARLREYRELKAAYDPANVFCPHLLAGPPEAAFIGERFAF
jgi:FAD/FMN-containing dehydrogenase